MATNWDAILSNTNNLQDVLSILKKVLASLDIKADITTIDEALTLINSLDADVQEKLSDVTAAITKFNNTGGFISAPTLEALQAITPEYDYQVARVDATGDEYRWNIDALPEPVWEPTGRNYLKDSIDYSDEKTALLNIGLNPTSEIIDIKSQANISGYLDSSGSIIFPDANWNTSDFIEIKRLNTIDVNLIGTSIIKSLCFYDKDKIFIAGFGTSSNTSQYYAATVDVPANAMYFRFTRATPNLPEFTSAQIAAQYLKVIVYQNVYAYEKFDEIDIKINNLESGLSDVVVDLWDYATINGYYSKTGQLEGTGDTNWVRSDLLNIQQLVGELTETAKINLRCTGHTALGSLLFFDENRTLIIAYGASANTVLYTGEFEIPENAVYVAVSGGSKLIPGGIQDSHANLSNQLLVVKEVLNLMSGQTSKESYTLLAPVAVYTTCNDVGTAQNKGRLRNYSAAIYLDHFFNALTSEKNIRFKDAVDRFVFTSSLVVTDANEDAPAVMFNEGVNAKEVVKTIKIVGSDISDTQISVKHRSALNSVTASTTPRVLCIGDSITYGEQALIPDDNYTQNHCYHLIAKELFMKDKIDNSKNGFDALFLGTKSKSKTFTYNGNTQTVNTHHEGIRGISLSQHLSGTIATEFWDSANSKWSVNAWLAKYRTLDDSGNRLTLGNGTGSLIDAGNLNSIDVCTPTHVVIALGMNAGGTLSQYQQMINTIRTEIPNAKIALVAMPVSGTYFPSLHPNCSEKSIFWNDFDNIVSKRNQQYNLLKMFQENFTESNNVFIVPFFHSTPTAEAVASRKSNIIDGEYSSVLDSKRIEHFGWGANIHTNGLGHINWGYQLYSWIKWTIANS
ncbi:hypothetical protein [Acinetobacter soli]|uniref:hypothetical protein n=1 Tax=Acinetobacter soli TaxID=487316 RepID=UPI000B4CEC82|nr:hypothetical protein [Acinetobacter soli]